MKDDNYRLIGLYLLLLGAALCWLCSCGQTRYVTIEKAGTEYRDRTDTVERTDTIERLRETVIREADSALVSQLGLRLRDGERAILVLQREIERLAARSREITHDTLLRTDTVPIPVPVERKLSKWEQACLDYGKLAFGASAVLALLLLLALFSWLRRKMAKPP